MNGSWSTNAGELIVCQACCIFPVCGNGTFSDLEGGWVVGGGLEWMLSRYWSAKLEYLHYDLGNASFSSTASSGFFATPIYQNSLSTARFQGELVRAGVNFHF